MKLVTLFRHAKSGWKNSPAMDDIDRPLNERGIAAAKAMGKAMAEAHIKPDLILCSPSVRTRQTLELAEAGGDFDHGAKVVFDARFYHSDPSTMMSILHDLPETVTHAMIVGHNPGLQNLAVRFVSKLTSAPAHAFDHEFPTASIASFSFDIDSWQQLSVSKCHLMLFKTPKQLGIGE